MEGYYFTVEELKSGNTGLDPLEVELALKVMLQNGDNVAHFGCAGSFLYSEKQEPKYNIN